jgi:hypothetical protein
MSELRDCKERIKVFSNIYNLLYLLLALIIYELLHCVYFKELSNEIINLEEELLCLQRQFEVESQHCAPSFSIFQVLLSS